MLHYDFDDLGRQAAGDGASIQLWPVSALDRPKDDYDDLMGAWLVERSRAVEAELLLNRAREILDRLEKRAPPATRRATRRLIGEIDDQLA